jgi:hypothetical protein
MGMVHLLDYIEGFSSNRFGLGIAMGVMFYKLFNLLRP